MKLKPENILLLRKSHFDKVSTFEFSHLYMQGRKKQKFSTFRDGFSWLSESKETKNG